MTKGNSNKLPDFIVLSVPKAGTTSLHYTLKKHKGICMPLQKETHFFNQHFDRGIEWYKNKFYHCRRGHIVGEVTTNVILEDNFAAKLKKVLNPETKYVLLLRDPVERAFSHYLHCVRTGVENKKFLEALMEESFRNKKQSVCRNPYLFSYQKIGFLYKRSAQQLYNNFPKSNIKVFLLEEIIENPKESLDALFNFIGASTQNDINRLVKVNVARMPKNTVIKFFYSLPHRLFSFVHFPVLEEIIPLKLKAKTRCLRSKINHKLEDVKELAYQPIKKPVMPFQCRSLLEEKFNKELKGLDELIVKPIQKYWPWWGQN